MKSGRGLLGWLALSFSASVGAVFVSTGDWYARLVKPPWSPAAWVFGPAWTILYTLMAVAAWLVWREGGYTAQRLPLGLFLVQWFLNALWTPIFFGLHRSDLAFVEIVIFWLALLATLVSFWRVRPLAGALLIPYLLWVTFAATLIYSLWRLNPE